MNLAIKEILFVRIRFFLIVCGVTAMVTATIGMIGLYRGLIYEALLMIHESGADLWIAQGGTHGPYAELSQVPTSLDRRVEGIAGVKDVRRFLQFNRQDQFNGQRIGVVLAGLEFPKDSGLWLPLIAGHALTAGHYEAVADRSTGLALGDVIRLGRDDYTIVGVTRGQMDIEGDGLLYVTMLDALTINRYATSEAILLGRTGKVQSAQQGDYVSAVLVTLDPAADLQKVRNLIQHWGDVEVFTRDDEVDMMVNGRLYKTRIQILAFVVTMLAVTGAVVSLSIYASVLEKAHSIAMLKLIGARDRVIVGMIVQTALLVAVCGFALALVVAKIIFPYFPRTVLIEPGDMAALGMAILVTCIVASVFGVIRAMRIRPQDVLS